MILSSQLEKVLMNHPDFAVVENKGEKIILSPLTEDFRSGLKNLVNNISLSTNLQYYATILEEIAVLRLMN